MLDDGDKAPDFNLPSTDGGSISLSGLRGQPVILMFYPKDDTSGCTREAKDFTDLKAKFTRAGATIVGISPDNEASHEKFKAKHGLKIDLASDVTKKTASAYGVWVEKSMYGRKYMGIERTTFLIDENSRIEKIWRKVKVLGHAEAVLAAVKERTPSPRA
jgi:thioredoxin-dependent peroxiredoxin